MGKSLLADPVTTGCQRQVDGSTERKEGFYEMEDFLRSCHDAIKDNEPKSLAAKMGLPHVSLLQRSNPDNDAHHLTIEHLYGVLLHTGDLRPLRALAAEFGLELVSKDQEAATTLTSALLHMSAE